MVFPVFKLSTTALMAGTTALPAPLKRATDSPTGITSPSRPNVRAALPMPEANGTSIKLCQTDEMRLPTI